MTIKEHPIIFNAAMIRAILAGRKSQTRRVMKPQLECLEEHPEFTLYKWRKWLPYLPQDAHLLAKHCPYGKPGDRLWVRETWHAAKHYDHLKPSLTLVSSPLWYAVGHRDHDGWAIKGKKRPSIFMPRWASRITLEIVDVRVERVQDITGRDAIAEGWPGDEYARLTAELVHPPTISGNAAIKWFAELWDSINAKKGFGWDANPFCWCISFRRIEQ